MSEWTDFRDSIVDSLKFEEVTEGLKEQFSAWLMETALPLAHTAAENFISQIKEQAKSEKGWCKARDMIVLPAVINLGLWATKKALTKVNTQS